MTEFRDGRLLLITLGPLGQFGNNAYVVADAETKDAVIVDGPQESEKVLEAAKGLNVRRILVTHRHGDHWAGIDLLRSRTGAPVYCHESDASPYEDRVAGSLSDGEEVRVGEVALKVIHTPGHTPGSICLLVGKYLISGDTLFPGGPGRTNRPEDLRQEIESITSRLYGLPDDTRVLPGHGDDTTIGESKREHEVFAAREHPADLAGDVTWAGS